MKKAGKNKGTSLHLNRETKPPRESTALDLEDGTRNRVPPECTAHHLHGLLILPIEFFLLL